MPGRRVVLKSYAKFKVKHFCWSLLFKKVACCGLAFFFKKRGRQHRCFLVSFSELLFCELLLLKTLFSQSLLTQNVKVRYCNVLLYNFFLKQTNKQTNTEVNKSTKTNKTVILSLLSMIEDDKKIKLLFRYDQEI